MRIDVNVKTEQSLK